jgi:hypothetical protein
MTSKQFDVEQRTRQSASDTGRNLLLGWCLRAGGGGGASVRLGKPWMDTARALAWEAQAGRLDADAVTAIVEAAGQRATRLERQAGLTERKAQVISMLAPGLRTKQVAPRARDLSQDRRSSRPERLPQDRRLDPRRGDAVRHGERARRMGRTPDGAARGSLLASCQTGTPGGARSQGGMR